MSEGDERTARLVGREQAVQASPMSGEAWAELGEAYAEMGQHELAVTALRRATKLEESRPWAWYQLSLSLAELDEREEALHAARMAVAHTADRDSFWMRVNLGRHLLRGGRPHEAVRQLEEANRRVPQGRRAVGLLGVAYFRVEQYGAAAECLEDSLRWEPDDPVRWACLGASLDETGRREGAVFALETAVFGAPDYAWAWGRLGKALRALGRHEEAVRAFEKSVEHGFAPPVLWSDMGDSAAEVRDVARLRRACRELSRLDAAMAKPLRRRLRSLLAEERTQASGVKPPGRLCRSGAGPEVSECAGPAS